MCGQRFEKGFDLKVMVEVLRFVKDFIRKDRERKCCIKTECGHLDGGKKGWVQGQGPRVKEEERSRRPSGEPATEVKGKVSRKSRF